VKSITVNGEDMAAQMEAQMTQRLAQMTADTSMPDSLKQLMVAQVQEQMTKMKESMMATRFTFNADGTYSITGGESTENGKWQLIDSNKKLVTTNAENRSDTVEVVTMTETALVIKNARDGQATEMSFERAAAAN
jgi:hypothetical protein